MFTQGLSREVGSRGITVNNVQPGPIDTDLGPADCDWAVPQKAATALDRYGHVHEVAALVAVRGWSGGVVHHRHEPYRRRRHQRLTDKSVISSLQKAGLQRDALELARNYRAGELTTVWLSDAARQALRDALRRVPVYLNRQLSRRTCPR